MKYIIFSLCMILCACSSLSGDFVVAVDDSLTVILPRYKAYVAADAELKTEDVEIIQRSCDELEKLVREERARQE